MFKTHKNKNEAYWLIQKEMQKKAQSSKSSQMLLSKTFLEVIKQQM